jgi:hypothetical protein
MNPTSYHLLNAETLACLKPGAVIINTARGRIIDEPALVAALQSGQVGGAALDVFENRTAASRFTAAGHGPGHAGPAQFQLQPGRLGAGALEYDPQPVGCIGDRAWGSGLIQVRDQWVRVMGLSSMTHYRSHHLYLEGIGRRLHHDRTTHCTGNRSCGGIGRATVHLFAEKGWIVIGVDRCDFGEPFPCQWALYPG